MAYCLSLGHLLEFKLRGVVVVCGCWHLLLCVVFWWALIDAVVVWLLWRAGQVFPPCPVPPPWE